MRKGRKSEGKEREEERKIKWNLRKKETHDTEEIAFKIHPLQVNRPSNNLVKKNGVDEYSSRPLLDLILSDFIR